MGIFNKLAGLSTADILSGEIRTRMRTMGSEALAALAYMNMLLNYRRLLDRLPSPALESLRQSLNTLRGLLPLSRRMRELKRLSINVLGPVPGVDVMAKRPQGLLNVGTLSARMAVLRSCALGI
jgi:hypothetical protein